MVWSHGALKQEPTSLKLTTMPASDGGRRMSTGVTSNLPLRCSTSHGNRREMLDVLRECIPNLLRAVYELVSRRFISRKKLRYETTEGGKRQLDVALPVLRHASLTIVEYGFDPTAQYIKNNTSLIKYWKRLCQHKM